MKKILLINPWICDFAAYDFWIKPLGLLYLASLLRENGYSVDYIDCLNPYHPGALDGKHLNPPKRKPSGEGKFLKETISKPEPLKNIPRRYSRYGTPPHILKEELALRNTPDIVFVTSMMTYWYPGVFDVISFAKEIFPGVPVVLGGNYATLLREHATRFSGADMIVTGEGEEHLARVLKDFLGDDPQFLPDRSDLDSYPYPAFDLLPPRDQVPVMTSRGCPFRCTYCASHLLNDGFRVRDPVKVVDEIEFWHRRYGIQNFSFYDDALFVNAKERAVPLLKEIIRRKLECDFHCPNGLHLREITESLSRLMFKARFRTVRFGIETTEIERQIETGGKITNEEAREAIVNLRQAGYTEKDLGMYILCGLPDQAATEVRESILCIKSWGARPIIAEYSPIPGTVLWEEATRTSSYNISEEPLFHNNSLLPCRSEQLTYEMYEALKILTRSI